MCGFLTGAVIASAIAGALRAGIRYVIGNVRDIGDDGCGGCCAPRR